MQRLTAVMAAPDADTGGIHERSDVVGVHALDQEGGQGTTLGLLLGGGAQNAHSVDGLKPLEQMAGELRFPGLNRLEADGLQIADRRTHADRFTDGGGAGLELVRQIRPGAVIEEDVLNHFAAPEEGRHRLQQRLARPEEPHPGGTTQLVGGRHQEIGTQRGDVGGLVGQALTGIHQHQGTGGMGGGDHLIEGVAAAETVADMHQAHQTSAVAELGAEVVEIQFTGFRDADVAQHTTGALGQQLPGHQVAVVLHEGEQHLIPRAQVGVTPAAGHQVDRLAGIAGEHDLPRTGCTDELRSRGPGGLEGFGGADAELVGTAMHIGVVAGVVVLQGLEHRERLLAGGSVIQVDQRATVSGALLQNREISTIS